MLEKSRAKLKFLYYKLIIERESPARIARGVAIGVFMSVSPLIGLHTVIIIILAYLLKGSKTAAILGSFLCNPLTIPVILFIDYEVGLFVCKQFHLNYTQMLLSDFKDFHLLDQGLEIFIPAMVGSVIIGCVLSLISYRISKKYFTRIFNERNQIS